MTTLTLPERIAVDAVIQAAMDMEAKPLLDVLEPLEGEETPQTLVAGTFGRAVQRFVLGTLEGRKVIVATTGIGLANAAAAAARALVLVDTPIFIAAGTTGGLARDIEVGDIAGGVSTLYGQTDATAFGYAYGQVPQMPADYASSESAVDRLGRLGARIDHTVRSGQILSQDSFVTQQVSEPLRAQFPTAIACDMETCAMAQVAWSAGVDWISLRAVSDLCGPGADQQFHMDGERAAGHSAEAVRAFLRLED